MELNQARDVKDNKKSFSKYISNTRLGQVWDPYWKKWKTFLLRTRKRLREWRPSFPQPLPARIPLRNPSFHRPGRKAGARKMSSRWKRIRSGNTQANSEQVSPCPWWDASIDAEGPGRCCCEATCNNPWLTMVSGRSVQRLEESKCHSSLPEGWEGRCGEPHGSQPHLEPQEDRASDPANHWQVHEWHAVQKWN